MTEANRLLSLHSPFYFWLCSEWLVSIRSLSFSTKLMSLRLLVRLPLRRPARPTHILRHIELLPLISLNSTILYSVHDS